MKTVVLLLTLAFSQVHAAGFAQNVTIHVKNASLEQVFDKIQEQTGYDFLYNSMLIKDVQTFDINVNNTSLLKVLDACFENQNLVYEIDNKTVLIKRKPRRVGDNQSRTILQPKEISGKVTNDAGLPLVGVGVRLKNGNVSTVTDQNGQFILSIQPNQTLVFSYMGYDTQELIYQNETQLSIQMKPSSVFMEEVVVVGYGKQRRITVTGSVSSISGDKLTAAPIASTTNTLAGRLPGLISKQSSGLPGADAASISIRGFGNALVIVDGVESDFNTIDPNQIETISILKDASAAIYGSRAGNGVILVTTKRGKIGKPIITLNSSQTWQGITDMPQPVSAGQYAELQSEAWLQSGKPAEQVPWTESEIAKFYDGSDPLFPNTNWYNELVRTWTPQQQHNLSIRGGSEKIKFYTFLGFLDQETVWKRNSGGYKRYNFQSNIDAEILENLSMQLTLSSKVEDRLFPVRPQGQGRDGTVWTDFWQTLPIYPARFPDPTKVSYAAGGGTGGAHVTSNNELSGYNASDYQDMRGSLALNYSVNQIEGLSARAFVDYNQSYNSNKNFTKPVDLWTFDPASGNYDQEGSYNTSPSLSHSESRGRVLTSQLSLNYETTFSQDHHLSAMGLYELIDFSDQWISARRDNFLSGEIDQLFAGSSSGMSNDGAASQMGRSSYVGRLNYNYKDKYLLESTLRADASAKFPSNKRWGYFPSISLGWVLSEESFMQRFLKPTDILKIRTSYGQMGNDAVGNFQYLAGYGFGRTYVFDSQPRQSLQVRGLANPNLTWEKIEIYNIGLDLSLLNGLLYSEADVFYRERSGIPATRIASLPSTFGAKLPPENINSLNDRGFEFKLGTAGHKGDLRWDVSGNISWSRSKWDHYEEPEYTDPDQIRINKTSGRWTNVTFGYLSKGLFTSQEEIDALDFDQDKQGNLSLRPGDIRFVDVNQDGVLDWKDQVEIGKGTTPNWMFGLSTNLTYKNFHFSALIQGAMGYANYINPSSGSVPFEFYYSERWTAENNDSNAFIPRIGGTGTNSSTSDHWLKKAAFARLKSLSIGYGLPTSFLEKYNVAQFKLFAAATNLFTINPLKKYGVDPEAPSGNAGTYYPQQRTLSLGLTISL